MKNIDELKQAIEIAATADDLRRIDKDFKDHMRKIYTAEKPEDFLALANMFLVSAKLHIKLGSITGEIKSYNDATIRCQYTLKTLEKAEEKSTEKTLAFRQDLYQLKELCLSSLKDIQTLIVVKCGVDLPLSEKITDLESIDKISHKKLLEDLRDHSKAHITTDVVGTKALFGEIADRMKMYLKTLYEEAESVLGEPPCKYTVIGLGSMALGQTTPYSDLEFAILTEEHKKDENLKIYFRNLTHYVHFKVICLGETIIPTSDYNVNMNYIVETGVNFDLGGKTPLGRIEKDKDYDLIDTVDGMYKNLYSEGVDKNLQTIMEKQCLVYGEASLLEKYQEGVKDYLSVLVYDNQTNYEVSAIIKLAEGPFEIDKKGIRKYFPGNLEEFQFKPSENEGQLFNVKQEIYRVPDRMIYNLGLIYGIQKDNPWDTLDELVKQNFIKLEAGENLKEALSFALNLRLKIYGHYGCQKDKMDTDSQFGASDDKKLEAIFRLSEEELSESGSLFKFYYTAFPLMKRIKEFCEEAKKLTQDAKNKFFISEESSDNNFYNNTSSIKGDVNRRLNKLEDALKFYKEEEKFLENQPKIIDIVINFNKLNLINHSLREYEESFKYARKALEKLAESKRNGDIYPKMDIDILEALNNVGSGYRLRKDAENALKYLGQALDMCKKTFRDAIHPYTADILDNIAGIHATTFEDYNKAIKYSKEALKIREQFSNKKDIAFSLSNVGSHYSSFGNYSEAIKYLEKALETWKKIYEGKAHNYIVSFLGNIGDTCFKFGMYKKATEFSLERIQMVKKLYGEDSVEVKNCNRIFREYMLKLKTSTDESRKQFEEAEFLQKSGEVSLSENQDIRNVKKKFFKPAEKLYESSKNTFKKLSDEKKVIEILKKLQEIYKLTKESGKEDEVLEELTKIDNIGEDSHLISYDQKDEFNLTRSITNFTPVTEKQERDLRVISYNIAADYFDKGDSTEDQRHHWHYRAPFVKKLLSMLCPDIMCLQELSPDQAMMLVEYFNERFESIFLSQTPSEIETGAIVRNQEVKDWCGKNIGTPLVGIFFSKALHILQHGRFWLNENPNEVPDKTDRGETDKGFGNMHTYRAVLWVQIDDAADKPLFIFNSHYPLSGNSYTRLTCAELEMSQIKTIAGDNHWISCGDRNLIPGSDDSRDCNPQAIYQMLVRAGHDIRDAKIHYGTSTTWLGFSHDKYKAAIDPLAIKDHSVLDVMVSNNVAALSFCHPGLFDPKDGQLIDIVMYDDNAPLQRGRYFASDHSLIGADFTVMD